MSRSRRKQESGFALVLVMAMAAVIAVMLYREMPRAMFEGQRAKEELLVQRGEQYYRAIQLYSRKFGRYPASIEQLENTNNIRFLRRRYKDPMTGSEEWRIIHAGPGGIFTDSLTRKPPQLNKDGKLASGQTPFGAGAGGQTAPGAGTGGQTAPGAGAPDAAAVAAPVDPNAPKPVWAPRRQSDMAGFTPPPASEGSAESAGYSPPPQDPNDPNYAGQQAEAPSQQQPQPGQLQYPYAQGQVVAGQPMQPGQPGVIGISGGMVTPQAGGFAGQPGSPQQPGGFGPQPGFQPAQLQSAESGAVQGSPDQPQPQQQYPAQIQPGGASYGQQRPPGIYGNPQFGQQPINPVTPYAPQPPVQTFGVGPGTAAPNPNVNPALAAIQAQLTGGTARTGFGGPGGQTLGGGIAGVASKAEAEGIKVYKKRTKYNEWEFLYVPTEDLTNPSSRGVMPQPGFSAGPYTPRPGGPTQ